MLKRAFSWAQLHEFAAKYVAPDAANGKSPESPTHSSVSACAASVPSTFPETPLTSRAVLSSEPVSNRPSVFG